MAPGTVAQTTEITNEASAGLPPLSEARRTVWQSYRIAFLQDGLPVRLADSGSCVVEPIYPTYVIADFLASFARTGEAHYLLGASRVADAALSRLEPVTSGGLAFPHSPHTHGGGAAERRYHAATQARYLAVLSRLYQASQKDRFRSAAQALLLSLTVPTGDGGVLGRTPQGGAVIEEWSNSTAEYPWASWARSTLTVAEYEAWSGDPNAARLVTQCTAGLRELLPLYDVAEWATSRAKLTGVARLKLTFRDDAARISAPAIVVPGQGLRTISLRADDRGASRFVRGFDRKGHCLERVAVADVALSRVSWPVPNRFIGRIKVSRPGQVVVQVGQGDFNPLAAQLRATTFKTLATLSLQPGDNDIEVPIGWNDAELVAHPTHFAADRAGTHRNATHMSHIDSLRKLAALTDDDLFRYYAARWQAYTERWASMQVYTEATGAP